MVHEIIIKYDDVKDVVTIRERGDVRCCCVYGLTNESLEQVAHDLAECLERYLLAEDE